MRIVTLRNDVLPSQDCGTFLVLPPFCALFSIMQVEANLVNSIKKEANVLSKKKQTTTRRTLIGRTREPDGDLSETQIGANQLRHGSQRIPLFLLIVPWQPGAQFFSFLCLERLFAFLFVDSLFLVHYHTLISISTTLLFILLLHTSHNTIHMSSFGKRAGKFFSKVARGKHRQSQQTITM